MLRSVFLSLAFLSMLAPCWGQAEDDVNSDQFTILHYNNPEATPDLGVGLYAWPVAVDVNGDNLVDLIVSSSAWPTVGYNGTYYFENSGKNEGDSKFPIFKPAKRLSRSQHYICGCYVDGKLRVLTPGNEYPDFCKTGLSDPKPLTLPPSYFGGCETLSAYDAKSNPIPASAQHRKVRGNMWRYVDFNGDGKTDIAIGTGDWADYGWENAFDADGNWRSGPVHGKIYIALNKGSNENPEYEDAFNLMDPYGRDLEVYGWPSPNFVDYDHDGDLDIICGCFLDYFTCFENIGTRTSPKYIDRGTIRDPDGATVKMTLEMIAPMVFDWDGDGNDDIICGDEDGRVALVENTGTLADGKPIFLAPRYFKQEADLLKCGDLCSPWGCDWDGDGDWDIICGNAAGFLCFIENLSGPGVYPPSWAAPVELAAGDENPFRVIAGPSGSIQGPAESKWGYLTQSVADWDGDGLPDILVNSIWGRPFWLKNIGTRSEPKLAAPEPIIVEWNGPQPLLNWGWDRPQGKELLTQWRTTPVAFDWNQDGLMDLIMLDSEGYLAFFERKKLENGSLILLAPVRLFKNEDGSPLRLSDGFAGNSGRCKLCFTDWNGDGLIDIIINGKNADVYLQVKTEQEGVVLKNTGPLTDQPLAGHSTHPSVVDFDNNGIPDLILGAEDGFIFYYKNRGYKNVE